MDSPLWMTRNWSLVHDVGTAFHTCKRIDIRFNYNNHVLMRRKCSLCKTSSVYTIQYTHSLAVLGSLKHPSTSILNVFHRDVNYDAYHIILS